MEHVVDRPCNLDVLRHVVTVERERVVAYVRDVRQRPGVEVVQADHPVACLKQVLAEVRTEKPGSAGDNGRGHGWIVAEGRPPHRQVGRATAPGTVQRVRIRVERATLAAITLYGLVLRTRALAIESPHPLRPDAQVYRALARLLPTPYETGIREPGWPWLIRIWSELFGPSDAAQRTLTVMLSTALIPILWWLGRALTGRASVGLFGALLVASSDALVLQSPAGLRLESWTVALAVFGFGGQT